MTYDPRKHHRRSIRLQRYDYASPGAYFITVCVQHRECLLGHVVDGEMQLNVCGHIVDDFWEMVPAHFAGGARTLVAVDAHVTMPNHIHAIVVITGAGEDGEGAATAPLRRTDTMIARPKLGRIVAFFKYQTTKMINEVQDTPGARFWQRNHWEHVIRDERAYRKIRQYVENNPARWELDRLHPDAPPNRFN